MKTRAILSKVIAIFTPENLGYALDTFSKGVQEFGNAMDSVTKEFSDDIAKSNKGHSIREQRDRQNVDKLLGKKKDLW